MPLLLQDAAQRVEDLRAGAQRLGKRGRADRHHHELLEVHAAVGVRAAVEDVHHRHRQHRAAVRAAVEPGEVAVERHAGRGRRRARQRHRHAEQRVGAEPPLVLGSVEADHRLVDRPLIGLAAGDGFRDLAVDVADRLGDAFPEIALLVAVAELQRFTLPRRRARRHCRPAERPAVEGDFDFNRGIAARVDNLAPVHFLNLQNSLLSGGLRPGTPCAVAREGPGPAPLRERASSARAPLLAAARNARTANPRLTVPIPAGRTRLRTAAPRRGSGR